MTLWWWPFCDFLLQPIVAAEDGSRPIWPGCPSLGWSSGVHRLTGLPNGKKFSSVADVESEQQGMLQLSDGAEAQQEVGHPHLILTSSSPHPHIILIILSPHPHLILTQALAAVGEDAPTCTWEAGFDWQNSAGGKSTPAKTKEACCAECWADKYCVVATFVESTTTCWMKYENTGKVAKPGVM